MEGLFFDLLPADDIPAAHAIELAGKLSALRMAEHPCGAPIQYPTFAGFPGDEAASADAFRCGALEYQAVIALICTADIGSKMPRISSSELTYLLESSLAISAARRPPPQR
jgi:hypothetical protein